MSDTISTWFIYILRCADETLYTGITNKLSERIKKHNSGKGAKYTRSRLPVKIAYQEEVGEKGKALQREYAIKQLTRKEKLLMIKDFKAEENIEPE